MWQVGPLVPLIAVALAISAILAHARVQRTGALALILEGAALAGYVGGIALVLLAIWLLLFGMVFSVTPAALALILGYAALGIAIKRACSRTLSFGLFSSRYLIAALTIALLAGAGYLEAGWKSRQLQRIASADESEVVRGLSALARNPLCGASCLPLACDRLRVVPSRVTDAAAVFRTIADREQGKSWIMTRCTRKVCEAFGYGTFERKDLADPVQLSAYLGPDWGKKCWGKDG